MIIDQIYLLLIFFVESGLSALAASYTIGFNYTIAIALSSAWAKKCIKLFRYDLIYYSFYVNIPCINAPSIP